VKFNVCVDDEFLFGDNISIRCWNVMWKKTCKNVNKTTTTTYNNK